MAAATAILPHCNIAAAGKDQGAPTGLKVGTLIIHIPANIPTLGSKAPLLCKPFNVCTSIWRRIKAWDINSKREMHICLDHRMFFFFLIRWFPFKLFEIPQGTPQELEELSQPSQDWEGLGSQPKVSGDLPSSYLDESTLEAENPYSF